MPTSDFKPKLSQKYMDNYTRIFRPTLFQRIKNWFKRVLT